jgi:hypothetical protein
MKHYRVLNLGAGVQSTAIFLMLADGELPAVDFAVFADVGDEPEFVYDHLRYLIGLNVMPVHICSQGRLGDDLICGQNSSGGGGGRFVSIPAHLSADDDGQATAIGRRQCTAEYKIRPIEKKIRELVGATPGRPLPQGVTVTQVFGLSFDEPRRVDRVRTQFANRKQWAAEFPLFNDFVTRADCVRYLEKRLPDRQVPRSACVFCPYKSDDEWLLLRQTDPAGWQRAVEIDRAIRDKTSVCTQGMQSAQYLHRSCTPLELVQLNPSAPDRQKKMIWSDMDCEGMCGV